METETEKESVLGFSLMLGPKVAPCAECTESLPFLLACKIPSFCPIFFYFQFPVLLSSRGQVLIQTLKNHSIRIWTSSANLQLWTTMPTTLARESGAQGPWRTAIWSRLFKSVDLPAVSFRHILHKILRLWLKCSSVSILIRLVLPHSLALYWICLKYYSVHWVQWPR